MLKTYGCCNREIPLIKINHDVLVTPISSPGCEYQFGIYPDGNECSTHYIKCAHGEPIAEQCEPGLVYDDRIHGCNWPDLLLEKCNPEGNAFVKKSKSSL